MGSGVLDWLETLATAAECQKRWNADIAKRLAAEKERLFARSDYTELAAKNREGLREHGKKWHQTYEAEYLKEDIEGSIRQMAEMDPASVAKPPRLFKVRVPGPYGLKARILDEVAEWASARFGKQVSTGLVDAAWNIQRRVDREDV